MMLTAIATYGDYKHTKCTARRWCTVTTAVVDCHKQLDCLCEQLYHAVQGQHRIQ